MDNMESVDWFTDQTVHQNPYPYYEYLRSKGPAVLLPQHNVVAVTDYNEAMKVFRDTDRHSAVNAVTGPFPPLPFKPDGEDITAQIEAHRHEIAIGALAPSNAIVSIKHEPKLRGRSIARLGSWSRRHRDGRRVRHGFGRRQLSRTGGAPSGHL